MSSILPFAFVCFWHGALWQHLVWAALNWIGVFVEKVTYDVYKTRKVQDIEVGC